MMTGELHLDRWCIQEMQLTIQQFLLDLQPDLLFRHILKQSVRRAFGCTVFMAWIRTLSTTTLLNATMMMTTSLFTVHTDSTVLKMCTRRAASVSVQSGISSKGAENEKINKIINCIGLRRRIWNDFCRMCRC